MSPQALAFLDAYVTQENVIRAVILLIYLLMFFRFGWELPNIVMRKKVGVSVWSPVTMVTILIILSLLILLDVPNLFVEGDISIVRIKEEQLAVVLSASCFAVVVGWMGKYIINDNKDRVYKKTVLVTPGVGGTISEDYNKSSKIELGNALEKRVISRDGRGLLIALKGSWGSGKTLMLQQKYDELVKKDNAIVIYTSVIGTTNVNDFLALLLKEIGIRIEARTHICVASQLTRYLEAVSTAEPRVSFIQKLLPSDPSMNDVVDEISKILYKSGVKLYIFVDDVDRILDVNDLRLFLGITRVITSFKNCISVIAYDPRRMNLIVSSAISKMDEIDAQVFMEKFEDLAVTVAGAPSRLLADDLYQRINMANTTYKLGDEVDKVISKNKLKFYGDYRSVIKIYNDLENVIIKWDEYNGYLYFPDLFILTYNKYMMHKHKEKSNRTKHKEKSNRTKHKETGEERIVEAPMYASFEGHVRYEAGRVDVKSKVIDYKNDAEIGEMGIWYLEELSHNGKRDKKRFYNKNMVEKYFGLAPGNGE